MQERLGLFRRGGFGREVVPALLYVLGVFFLGSLPTGPELPHFYGQDKLVHFMIFAGMLVLVWRALRFYWPGMVLVGHLGLASVVSSGLGALLEAYQALLPSRSAELLDWVSDTAGILLAGIGVYLLEGRKARRAASRRAALATLADQAESSSPVPPPVR